MNRWLLVMCWLLLAPGLALAQEAPAPSDPMAARFEQALGARVDEVLDARVSLASQRALSLLEAREKLHATEVGDGVDHRAGADRDQEHVVRDPSISVAGRR